MAGNTFEIVTVGDLLRSNLQIPVYQRPYRWTGQSALTLLNDIYHAFCADIREYRIGSVVLHKNGNFLDIVDGQQRLTTLSILTACFEEVSGVSVPAGLLNAHYTELSYKAIQNNYQIIRQKCSDLFQEDKGLDKKKEFFNYLLNCCTMVRIITNSEQEAFQFFDSQNTRGKALAPHDLLKSYHLREMHDMSEKQKVHLINTWENTNQKALALLFENNLFPLVRWYKYKDGINYSEKEIATFKGIKKNSSFHFSVYHRAAHLYIEKFNSEGMYELMNGKQIEQFQLTEPIIAGERFFRYTLYYHELYLKVERLIQSMNDRGKIVIPQSGSGDMYVKNLFVNVLMMFVDRFHFEALTDARLMQLYKWSYTLRIAKKAVYKESVNRYAQGKSDFKESFNMFALISEMRSPEEMDAVLLDRNVEIAKALNSRYEPIVKIIRGESNA